MSHVQAVKQSTPASWSGEQMTRLGRAQHHSIWKQTLAYGMAVYGYIVRTLDRGLPVVDVNFWYAKFLRDRVLRPKAWQRRRSSSSKKGEK